MSQIVVDLVDPEGQLMAEIADPRIKRNDVALTYAFAIRQANRDPDRDQINFAKVNRAIVDRWSLSALTYIKERAWARVEGRR